MPLWKKIIAGGTAGAIASAIANPTDLMKIRLQTDGMMKDEAGNLLPKKYTGMVNCFSSIVKDEGVAALWTGVGPTAGRATALAAAERSRVVAALTDGATKEWFVTALGELAA